LQNNGVVYLTPNVTELDEVVISHHDPTFILSKAIHNLFAKFQEKKTKTDYLTHIETNTTRGDAKELYALVEAVSNKINVAKKRHNWILNLIKIDRTKKSDNDVFKYIGIRFFPDNLHFFPVEKDTAIIREIYEDNKEQLIIKTYPRHSDKKHYSYFLYTINKQDTTLIEVIAQSFSNVNEITTDKFRGINYNVSNHFHKYNFAGDASNRYYLKQLQHLISKKILSEAPYEITSKVILYSVENASEDDFYVKKKKIKSYDYSLYKSKLPDSPGFWKKYVTP
jgi:hypothetical protein